MVNGAFPAGLLVEICEPLVCRRPVRVVLGWSVCWSAYAVASEYENAARLARRPATRHGRSGCGRAQCRFVQADRRFARRMRLADSRERARRLATRAATSSRPSAAVTAARPARASSAPLGNRCFNGQPQLTVERIAGALSASPAKSRASPIFPRMIIVSQGESILDTAWSAVFRRLVASLTRSSPRAT